MDLWISLIFFFVSSLENIANAKDTNSVVNLIVIGANGDLAKRKIWPSLQEILYHDDNPYFLSVYAATREPVEETREMFRNYFSSLPCHVSWSLSHENCLKLNSKLSQIVHLVQLKNDTDYIELNGIIESQMKSQNSRESVRIFYLSVPPFAYRIICNFINSNIRPFLSNDTQLRIAIEKPFGSDLSSAKNLADEILSYMTHKEVFLVDHYLHKLGSQNILNFRVANPQFFSNPAHIDRIEIVAREFLDVKGRSRYYDQYGVIRDMIQNHLTELLTLLIVDLNTNLTSENFDLNTAKLHTLQSIYSPFTDSTVLGQYVDYNEHLLHDIGGTLIHSNTPTFAAVLVKMHSFDWLSVPIVLMSGKRLGKREAFVRISFKKPLTLNMQESPMCDVNDVIFNIDKACVIVPFEHNFNIPKGWNSTTVVSNGCNVIELCPLQRESQPIHSYSSVLESLIEGKSELFVPLFNILESWRIWSPLVEELNNQTESDLLLYNDDLLNNISFIINGSTLIMNHSNSHHEVNIDHLEKMNKFGSIWNHETQVNYPSNITLYTLPRTKFAHGVSEDIYHAAIKSIKYRNSFHIAFPGGSSPLYIYQSLISNYRFSNFPWSLTHLWQTDERCVPINTPHSNLYQLSLHLIEYIPIPYYNIHPLHPACRHTSVEYNISNRDDYDTISLDYVLLGIGQDGHIASLFTNYTNTSLLQNDQPIQYISLPSNYPIDIKERVSLSMITLLKARHISILIIGSGKCHLFKLLQDTLSRNNERNNYNNNDLPFIQLIKRAKLGTVKVWIDKNICKYY